MDFGLIIGSALSIGGLGILFGLGLGVAAKKFAIKVDPIVIELRDALPGANCGGCGYTGCDAFAKALAEGKAKPNGCPVGGDSTTQKVSTILGVEAAKSVRTTAYIKCKGNCHRAKDKYEYVGITDCVDASYLPGGGPKQCSYGCLGLGSCVKACNFGAIDIIDGIAVINEEKCVSCGMCVEACPKKLIEIIPYKKTIRVDCNSKESAKETMSACEVGCIGCKKCEKACRFDAFNFDGRLAHIDYDKCKMCRACIEVCPKGTITNHLHPKPAKKPAKKVS